MADFLDKLGREANRVILQLGAQVNRSVGRRNDPVKRSAEYRSGKGDSKIAHEQRKKHALQGKIIAGGTALAAGAGAYFTAPALGLSGASLGTAAGDLGGLAVKGAGSIVFDQIAAKLKGSGAAFPPDYLAGRLQALGPEGAQEAINTGRLSIEGLNRDYAGLSAHRGGQEPVIIEGEPSGPVGPLLFGAAVLVALYIALGRK